MARRSIWAPWRIGYLEGLTAAEAESSASGCFLCAAVAADANDAADRQRLVLLRDERGLLLLNRYPYTNGHLLAAPAAHVGDLEALNAEQRAALMELTVVGERLLKAAINPQGVNIGMNIGRCAGAGLPGHVHMHIVPRWHGDVNFIDVVGQARVIPQALERSYEALREALRAVV